MQVTVIEMLNLRRVFAAGAVPLAWAALLAGCAGSTRLLVDRSAPASSKQSAPSGSTQLTQPGLSTRNTTRIDGADPAVDAAEVALTAFPSIGQLLHPGAVVIAPETDWEASIAASALMARPIGAPLLYSDGATLPAVSTQALSELAPTGARHLNGVQVIRVGDAAPRPAGEKEAVIHGSDPYTITANIDKLLAAIDGRTSSNVVIASSSNPAYAMPAAGWAAESGDPVLFVDGSVIPAATRQALLSHHQPDIYVLGPASVIPDSTLSALKRYGSVKRISDTATDPASSSVDFAKYRDPPCRYAQPCAHVPGSFGWAIDSPGHGYVLLNASRTLDAAAASPLSGSGDYGPELLVTNPSTLPQSVADYLSVATPGYTEEGPTAAVYNRGWLIGGPNVISPAVQAEVDLLFEPQPVSGS